MRQPTRGEIREAADADREAVAQLLVSNNLPLAGFLEHYGSFVVATDGERVVGAAGVELHGDAALLRSVVTAESHRGTGLGALLTDAAIVRAKSYGARSVSLLTTTAAMFFSARGFQVVPWSVLPPSLGASAELKGACPRSATAMHRTL